MKQVREPWGVGGARQQQEPLLLPREGIVLGREGKELAIFREGIIPPFPARLGWPP